MLAVDSWPQDVSGPPRRGTAVNPVVLDFSDPTPAGADVHVTRAAVDAVTKEGKGTKEVEVPLDVIRDLSPLRARSTPAPAPVPVPRTSPGPGSLDTASTRPQDTDDEVLARRAALGDDQAFTVLADRHRPALHRLLRRMLADPGAVEDCLQETLLAAWRGLPGFRGEAEVRTWLFAIARRQVFAVSRKASPARSPVALDAAELTELVAAPGGGPAAACLDSALLQAIEDALRRLPPQQRSAWVLKEVEGSTYLQIATVLGVSPAAVRGLLARARVTLSAALREWR